MNPYPIFSARNVPAYAAVMVLWGLVSFCFAFLLRAVTAGAVGWRGALVFAGAAVMSGMAIMFGASVVNLRKLRPGFESLAKGELNPSIPPVWCLVLTMATRAAVGLSRKVRANGRAIPSAGVEMGSGDPS
jgi:hypothetical protein